MALNPEDKEKIYKYTRATFLMLAIAGVGLLICAVTQAIWGWSAVPWWAYVASYLLLGIMWAADSLEVRTRYSGFAFIPTPFEVVANVLIWAPYAIWILIRD